MKTLFSCSCAWLMLGFAALANAGPRADIVKLEEDFNAAYAANDLGKYFGYYAGDAILWFQDGRTDRRTSQWPMRSSRKPMYGSKPRAVGKSPMCTTLMPRRRHINNFGARRF
jgi:hypothetical protein